MLDDATYGGDSGKDETTTVSYEISDRGNDILEAVKASCEFSGQNEMMETVLMDKAPEAKNNLHVYQRMKLFLKRLVRAYPTRDMEFDEIPTTVKMGDALSKSTSVRVPQDTGKIISDAADYGLISQSCMVRGCAAEWIVDQIEEGEVDIDGLKEEDVREANKQWRAVKREPLLNFEVILKRYFQLDVEDTRRHLEEFRGHYKRVSQYFYEEFKPTKAYSHAKRHMDEDLIEDVEDVMSDCPDYDPDDE